jgi:prevent-host-death family protein
VSESRSIAAGQFKARCLALLDEVQETGLPLVVTKRGRPVARLVPIDREGPLPLEGSVSYDREKDLLDPVPERWEAEWNDESGE